MSDDLVERLRRRARAEESGGTCDLQMEDVGALLREAISAIEAKGKALAECRLAISGELNLADAMQVKLLEAREAERAAGKLALAAEREIARLCAENAALVDALMDAEEVLSLVERPAFPDPLYHEEVKRLGLRIGFGALMSTASAGWAEASAAEGYPTSGAFVAGPCIGTVHATLKRIRAALSLAPQEDQVMTAPDMTPEERAAKTRHSIVDLAQRCHDAAEFYQNKPGLAGAGTDIDLYKSIAYLAEAVAALLAQEGKE